MNVYEIQDAIEKALIDLQKCKPVIEIEIFFDDYIAPGKPGRIIARTYPGKPGRIIARTYIDSSWYLVSLKTDVFYTESSILKVYSDDYTFIDKGNKTEYISCESFTFDHVSLRSNELKRLISYMIDLLNEDHEKNRESDLLK